MKIKEFSIMRYGPLPNTGRILLNNFNLLFGKNENGKTLTIDALVKLLLERNTRDFEHIDRVEENPEGYVIIETDKGEEIKLPEKGDLTRITDLTPSECCNIFIVRNSNLSISRDLTQEGEFYTSVTDRLTGLRTREISKIKEVLREISKITPGGIFRDIKGEKLKTRIDHAEKLMEKIKSLSREIKEEGYDKAEEELARLKKRIEEIGDEIENLENARKREEYEKGKEALDKIRSALQGYEQLNIYNEADEQSWRDCERDIKTYLEEKKEALEELKAKEKEFEKKDEVLIKAKRDFQILDKRKRELDSQIGPELKTYEIKTGEFAQQEEKNKFFTPLGIISTVLLGISLLGVIFSASLLFYVLAGLFLILALFSGAFKYQLVRDRAWLAGMFERIKLSLSRFGLDAENIEEILSNIQRFDEEYNKKSEELQEIKGRKERLEDKIKELQYKTILDIEKKIKKAKEKINEIKRKSREDSLEGYTEKLKLKRKLERSIGEWESVLRSHFGQKSERLEENISYWDEKITKLEEYKDKATGIKYSEAAASELVEEKKKFIRRVKEIDEKMGLIHKEMEDVEREVNEILRLEEEYLYCKTSVDLGAINDKLREFLEENKCTKENVLEVIKIFEEMEKEEKEKVSELFGKGSSISKYFNEITDGLYKEVTFNQGTGEIEVKRKDGAILKPEKLSGGAYDQLYFSIRLALGEKLLKGKKGFFIMDDPFIKADHDRLKRQIGLLKKVSDLGWQIIYFSAKDEVRNVLRKSIEKGVVNYVQIQGIFS
ncbi:hypothetical protein J7M02_04930 [Candidatus Aerophobetes bacterium]|nr:hypothetical protein [Candidatus Aerophobetes bacterium]